MKCPKCQTENEEPRKYCRKCGEKLSIVCPSCGFENVLGDVFCGGCGQNLKVPSEPSPKKLSFDEKLDKIQRYLPEGLTDKILTQRDKIEGERKQVTVMFCDMEGFTQLAERLGPEEAYGIMDQVYEILIRKVHDYEGTVNEMTGDGIMALFGAPIALEDAPQRGVRSAMAIHREMAKFSDKLKQERKDIPPVKMRIGIHTGPVVVGTLGNNLRVEFKAVGDTVNLASRIEGLAEPGATYVTDETFKLTEGFFRFEALGEKEVKGKKEPVKVYRVIAPSAQRTRFDVSAERGLTPFVGRDRELELLLDGFERSKTGRGQAFSIMSEAGVGKSRLLYEFRKAVANEDVTFLEGMCLSYRRGVAYQPHVDILKSNFDIQDGDEDSEIAKKVRTGLKILEANETSTLPYLLELLSVKDSGIDKIPMSPEARKDRIIEALKRIVLKGSEIRPLIMAFEDLHWADKSSEDVLKDLLENIPGARVLLVFTYRPDFVPTWGAKSFHNQLTLNRLSNRESLAMVYHLLSTEDVDKSLEEIILEKTEGVPFFIEEFIRSLKNLKIIERKGNQYHLAKDIRTVSIPSTIQDGIMARVDSLPDGAKEVLQSGSVIEREFSYDLIKRVMGLPEVELLSHLSVLKDSELLYERGIYPQSRYIFKHALTLEVVYNSILTKTKKRLHREIGNAIEDLNSENIEEYYGVLAEHFIESEDYLKGAEYSKLARKKALKSASFRGAVEHSKKEIMCLEKLSMTEATLRKLVDSRTALANYFMSLNQHVEAKEAVAPIADLAAELKYDRKLPVIYTAIGTYSLYVEEDYSNGIRYLDKVFTTAEKAGDFVSLWFASYNLAVALSWNCEFEKGQEYFRKCLDLSELANNLIGICFTKGTVSAQNYTLHGKIDLAYHISKESLIMANESGDIYIQGMAYSSHGSSCYFKGLFDEAENFLLNAAALCEKTTHVGWGPWAYSWLAHLYIEKAEYEKARYYWRKAIAVQQEHGGIWPSWINFMKVSRVKPKALIKNQDINLGKLSNYYQNNNLKAIEGWIARILGEILLSVGDLYISEAEAWIKKAIDADKRNGMMWCLANDHALYAELSKRKGDKSKAKENLAKAVDILKECGADGWVEKYEKELEALL